MGQFNNKVAIVTGGGTGIGKQMTESLVAEGAKVVITGRRRGPLEALSQKHPEQIYFVQADVSKPNDPKRVVEYTIETLGQLDILINNAGTFASAPLVETSDEDITRVLNVNILGVLAFSREAIPYLSKTNGNIVNTSSVVATGVMPGISVYAASKAAVDHITRTLAAELGPQGIRVNAVSPGMTRTDMAAPMLEQMEESFAQQTPLARIGNPIDIANVALFLASNKAGWVTGQVLASSGGLML
ncbi:MAG: hypothetical protein CL920_23470 [Deltaproteobacteria bacterium]|nr:hypothetical protein [Deltaproteobacteria bacterium]MBU51661.1 hypothetical protein [Deltaproteobacteria bacterium]|tara:strand:+ start:6317 stop:7048 length:732 start_codon:yes stop_codon:yes gene_type:complete